MLSADQKEAMENLQCAAHALNREPAKDHPILNQLLQMLLPLLLTSTWHLPRRVMLPRPVL